MIQSLNFRLADSLPRTVLEQWKKELQLSDCREAALDSSSESNDYTELKMELRRRALFGCDCLHRGESCQSGTGSAENGMAVE